MLISKAYAQAIDLSTQAAPIDPPSAGEAFMWNMGMVLVLVVMFYFLLIRPQQKRFKEHSEMLSALTKGDPVVTGGGLIGKVGKIKDDDDEVEVDLGNGLKVKALKSS
ncbi:MAG: preprotein translocase subunit YajC, partial [Pseudomonadota bacterium]